MKHILLYKTKKELAVNVKDNDLEVPLQEWEEICIEKKDLLGLSLPKNSTVYFTSETDLKNESLYTVLSFYDYLIQRKIRCLFLDQLPKKYGYVKKQVVGRPKTILPVHVDQILDNYILQTKLKPISFKKTQEELNVSASAFNTLIKKRKQELEKQQVQNE